MGSSPTHRNQFLYKMLNKILEVLHTYFGIDNAAGDSYLDELGIDSLRMLELAYELEDNIGKDLSNLDFTKLKTVLDLANAIEQL